MKPGKFRVVVIFLGLLITLSGTVRAGAFDAQRAKEFLQLCQNTPTRLPHLSRIHWRMQIFQAVDKTFDVTPYVAYVRNLQNTDGGFGLWPKDVSTPEATWIAMRILDTAKTSSRDKTACVQYLKKTLEELAPQAERYWDLEIQRDVFRCLMSLSLLGHKPDKWKTYCKILERDGQPWGMYYRLKAGEAFGERPADPQAQIKRLDALAQDGYLKRTWTRDDLVYALEVMSILGGKFSNMDAIRDKLKWAANKPWSTGSWAWRSIRIAKLLGVDMPWLESYLGETRSLQSKHVGGYSEIPGMEIDLEATLLLQRLRNKVKPVAIPSLAENWKDKQRKEGYYLDFPETEKAPWITDLQPAKQQTIQIEQTWQAVASLKLAGVQPKDSAALVGWLQKILAQHYQDLSADSMQDILTSLAMLGEKPEHSDTLAKTIRKRFGSSLQGISLLRILGGNTSLPPAGQAITGLLDRIRVRKIPMEISLIWQQVKTLDALGEDYEGVEYFLNLLGQLQNPDGGIRAPYSVHSNLHNTLAALQLAETLPRLQKRFRQRHKISQNQP